MAAKKRRKPRESKGEKAIRKKRALDYALRFGTYGFPYEPT